MSAGRKLVETGKVDAWIPRRGCGRFFVYIDTGNGEPPRLATSKELAALNGPEYQPWERASYHTRMESQ